MRGARVVTVGEYKTSHGRKSGFIPSTVHKALFLRVEGTACHLALPTGKCGANTSGSGVEKKVGHCV